MLRVFLLSAVDSLIFQRLYRKIMATDTNYTARLEQVVKKKIARPMLGVEHWPFISKTYGSVILLTRQLLFHSYQLQ